MLKINNNGKILKYNKTFEEKILDHTDYISIYDLHIDNLDLDILEEILRQNLSHVNLKQNI